MWIELALSGAVTVVATAGGTVLGMAAADWWARRRR